MVSKLAVGVIVVAVVVGAGVGAYLLTRPVAEEAAEKYELSYDYQAGEYYVYETTSTTTSDSTVSTSLSSYTMQVTGVVGNQITFKYIGRENVGPPYLATEENVEVTMGGTMTNKGKTISWEIENVVPLELWENVEAYENSQMRWSRLLENVWGVFPYESVPIGENWGTSISCEMEWTPGTYMSATGEGERLLRWSGERHGRCRNLRLLAFRLRREHIGRTDKWLYGYGECDARRDSLVQQAKLRRCQVDDVHEHEPGSIRISLRISN